VQALEQTHAERPFSKGWLFASVVLFLAVELAIGTYVGPMVIGKYVSPMFHLQLQMTMHLASFYLGGVFVGLLSPGVRLMEPAIGAFISVAVVFMISFFMPTWFYQFEFTKLVVGGGIALVLAMAGAYSGEKLMGNVEPDGAEATTTARAKLWNESDGVWTPKSRDLR
jgi:hypothetical protein